MNECTFTKRLYVQAYSFQLSLLEAYEERDRLLYVVAPQVEQEYMEKIGTYEQEVIKAEIELELLLEKKVLIQTALNRRAAIDEAAIDQQLEEKRKALYSDAFGEAKQNTPDLTEEEAELLQQLYREILSRFHPNTNPDLPEAQKALYEKAIAAYRKQDLNSLVLLYNMLMATLQFDSSEDLLSAVQSTEKQARQPEMDYTLADSIFPFFAPTVEELTLTDDIARYKTATEETLAQLEDIHRQFPFNAMETLRSPELLADYRKQLDIRLQKAESEAAARKSEIQEMLKKAGA